MPSITLTKQYEKKDEKNKCMLLCGRMFKRYVSIIIIILLFGYDGIILAKLNVFVASYLCEKVKMM